MSGGYTILSLDEAETAQHRGSNLVPVRHALGFRAAGVNAWRADSGGQLIPPHTEDSGHEELYAVVRGRARFTVGEEEAEAPAGTLVFVPPDVFRTAVADEDGTIVFVTGGSAGVAFGSGGWDSFALADSYRQAGRLDEARTIMEQLIAAQPDFWATSYNAGCLEALAGEPDAAFEHLRRAKELDAEGESAEYFREDTDLDSLREDPRFAELLG
ncbi:MAG TPA: cupin domain-containing protein [Gaiellaceae bacterium]|nr:cupin domain-containing protein [Gaiellaceae bacterium]